MNKTRILTTLLLTATMTVAAQAAADLPGQKFHLRVSDLPKPYATVAVMNDAVMVPRPDGAMPKVPAGFKANVFADLRGSRWLTVAPNGDVFVSMPRDGTVLILRDSKGTGVADQTFTYLTGLSTPHFEGVAIANGYLYYSSTLGVFRVPYKDGDTVASGKPEKVTAGADIRQDGMHPSRNFAVAPDGTVYLCMGAYDSDSDYRPGAEIFKVAADGSMTTFASGLRNPVGVVFQPGTGNLYATVNERDGLGDGLPPDYFTSIQPGGFYGFPYSYAGKNLDPVWGPRDPGGKIASAITPDVLFPAHSAPIGLTFYTGSTFPKDYTGDAFVSLHGGWNSSVPTGNKVVRIHFVNGKPDGGYENFVTGFGNTGETAPGEPAKIWFKPAGLAIAKDGSLLIAGGAVWRVQYVGK